MREWLMKNAPGGPGDNNFRLVVFVPQKDVVSETFIRAHLERLPFQILVRYGLQHDLYDESGRRVWRWGKFFRIATWWLPLGARIAFLTSFLSRHLQSIKADAVLAEFGTTGSWVAPACGRVEVPLFVHFHGFDAWKEKVLKSYRAPYRRMFETAAGVVAVSKPMHEQLLGLGAHPERLLLSPYGVDTERFNGARPAERRPRFLAVGRFVEKKAPLLTLLAFSQVVASTSGARLTMVGEGPLLEPCKRLVNKLGISQFVTFAGRKTPAQISDLMREARVFVQHSLRADDGDCEGTPIAIVEAQMSGLPVVSTRHAGIPEVVVEGETGFLVDEGDVEGMGAAMLRLAESPELAGLMGAAARDHARRHFTLDRHLRDITRMIQAGVGYPG
jgi:colanic acid/amylovoran biosynthesis glycosyltransferase